MSAAGFLLDTNIPSEQIRSRPEPLVGRWLYEQPEQSLFLGAVTVGELRKGILLLAAGRRRSELERWFANDLIPRFSGSILSVTQSVGDRWGALSARRQVSGIALSATDGLFASTALEHGMTLVTRNVKDFVGLGVNILNPWDAQP